jgi:hypothetical protein
MPGTLTIDTTATFQALLLMASGPKLKFGSTEQDISARGERKWDVQAAVTFHAEPGMKPVSEVIAVTVTGPATDPCGSILPGTPIVFDRMRVGFTVPEARENGRGIRPPTCTRPTSPARPRPRPPNPQGARSGAHWSRPGRALHPWRHPCSPHPSYGSPTRGTTRSPG